MKIITVPAVTASEGQLACATQSTFINYDVISWNRGDLTVTRGQVTYGGINSNAEAYFDGAADATGP